MTRGNQRELARQKNMKKQGDSVKGKRRDDGLSAAACKQRDSEIMQQKQKKANEKKEEPKVLCSESLLFEEKNQSISH
ncbi:small EDRK-rich factor 2 [Sigmodon hispidus]